jgi:hypothetical protein
VEISMCRDDEFIRKGRILLNISSSNKRFTKLTLTKLDAETAGNKASINVCAGSILNME